MPCFLVVKCKQESSLFFFIITNLDIADVTNFVHPGTPLDDEATQRGTSVYLVERRIDMLPKPLTEGTFPLSYLGIFYLMLESLFVDVLVLFGTEGHLVTSFTL